MGSVAYTPTGVTHQTSASVTTSLIITIHVPASLASFGDYAGVRHNVRVRREVSVTTVDKQRVAEPVQKRRRHQDTKPERRRATIECGSEALRYMVPAFKAHGCSMNELASGVFPQWGVGCPIGAERTWKLGSCVPRGPPTRGQDGQRPPLLGLWSRQHPPAGV